MTNPVNAPRRSRFLASDAVAGIAVVLIVVGCILIGMTSLSTIRNTRDIGTACSEHPAPEHAVIGEGYEQTPRGSIWLLPPVLVCRVPLTTGESVTVYYDIGGWQGTGGAAMVAAGTAFWVLRKRQQVKA